MAFGRKNPPGPQKDSWFPADSWLPLPTPEVKEGGESVWEAWNEESRRMDLAFAPTQPSEVVPLSRGASEDPPRRHSGPWTTDDTMVLARRNNRACPRPALWAALYLLVEGDHYADLAPPPTQVWQWSKLSNLQRRLRFREHIEWAERHGKLDTMANYMESLAEADWVHMGEN
ncbi:hypothetical protein HHL11_09110 [Ramlibacter sp. G-1-2-2]|uniref:Uncharacterized protein n=1 Tax=Ramlibacter agri TaxID=2728837 RepID=A0A848GYX8_9BURK|nr:hypothetical protein [Ramlibacter agri]NML43906.1 hypothetical protein [Ramlibacter agri]